MPVSLQPLLDDVLGAVTADRRRLEEEAAASRRVAEAVQQHLLGPVSAPAPAGGVVGAARYVSATPEARVGGDFYDIFPLEDGRNVLAVGDASGKGLPAAGRAAQTRFLLRALLRGMAPDASPAAAVARLNDLLTADHRGEDGSFRVAFTTLTLAVVDPARREAQVVCAGGEPLLRIRPRPDRPPRVTAVADPGLVLGVAPAVCYPTVRVRLEPGDTLLLITDGITEARAWRRAPFFGVDGVAAAVAAAHRQKASPPDVASLLSFLFHEVMKSCNGQAQDDMCAVAASVP